MFHHPCRFKATTHEPIAVLSPSSPSPPIALSSVGALVPCAAPTLAEDVSQASDYCTALIPNL